MQLAELARTLPPARIGSASCIQNKLSIALLDGSCLKYQFNGKLESSTRIDVKDTIKCIDVHPEVTITAVRASLHIATAKKRFVLQLPFSPTASECTQDLYVCWNNASFLLAPITDLQRGLVTHVFPDSATDAIVSICGHSPTNLTVVTQNADTHAITATNYEILTAGLEVVFQTKFTTPGPASIVHTAGDITAAAVGSTVYALQHRSGGVFYREYPRTSIKAVAVVGIYIAVGLDGGNLAMIDSAAHPVGITTSTGDNPVDVLDLSARTDLNTHIAAIAVSQLPDHIIVGVVCERGPVFALTAIAPHAIDRQTRCRVRELLMHERYPSVVALAMSQPSCLAESLALIIRELSIASTAGGQVRHLSFLFRAMCTMAARLTVAVSDSRADPSGGTMAKATAPMFLALLDHRLYEMAFSLATLLKSRAALIAVMSKAGADDEDGVVSLCRAALDLPQDAAVTPARPEAAAMDELIAKLAAMAPGEMTEDDLCCLGTWYELNGKQAEARALFASRGLDIEAPGTVLGVEMTVGHADLLT
ncbi:hypothetical protein J8273_3459 [Carpediemonas membranifera]|uniref:Uncharacterized protein n=1 Tax=Carpediemonas membranifera TaxID=201153 RepID=A0A8J6E9G9_9EUKA|nr:hypothetical protein J8273_3459 [Carpediemonas membranifera]|eukprot:KAG9393325.1 hypothetical protein J8273_3459 [Carpediemonas membranifera]